VCDVLYLSCGWGGEVELVGFHCARLWRENVHNPAGIGVTMKELWHTTAGLLSMRGDGGSADHVDISGEFQDGGEFVEGCEWARRNSCRWRPH